jgi:hypothetical protein
MDVFVGPFCDAIASERIQRAADKLLQAREYAEDVRKSPWHFAIELQEFLALGMTHNDLRWLVAKEFVIHGLDQSSPTDSQRRVHVSEAMHLSPASCFIISEQGFNWLQDRKGKLSARSPAPAAETQCTPTWDPQRQELVCLDLLVKRFRLPAPNQKLILAAFQEECWTPRIDDPLPPHSEIVPKRRLHYTLIALNRNQKHELVRFLGDGNGTGVCWELTPQARHMLATA